MTNFEKTNICEIVNEMHNGSLLGIPADYSGVPMSFTRSLINQNIKVFPKESIIQSSKFRKFRDPGS